MLRTEAAHSRTLSGHFTAAVALAALRASGELPDG
jgi:hypothetical protein